MLLPQNETIKGDCALAMHWLIVHVCDLSILVEYVYGLKVSKQKTNWVGQFICQSDTIFRS